MRGLFLLSVLPALLASQEFRPLQFPADHGPHPQAPVEWWYVSGWFRGEEDLLFGYQATWFRVGVRREKRASQLAVGDLWFFHGALTEVAQGAHLTVERAARGGANWAGAAAGAQRVWCLDAELRRSGTGRWQVRFRLPGRAVELSLAATGPPLLHGDPPGWSRKGPGLAGGYYSLPRLATRGEVRRPGGARARVEGLSWLDHEWGEGRLAPGVVGWDWFAVSWPDGSDLMLYVLRCEGGAQSPFSAGTFRDGRGRRTLLQAEDFQVHAQRRWRSPRTGASYPAHWRLELLRLGETVTVTPLVADQEVVGRRLGVTYWEGLCRFHGPRGEALGYVELVGYAAPFRGALPRPGGR